jgi:hypothetical protein
MGGKSGNFYNGRLPLLWDATPLALTRIPKAAMPKNPTKAQTIVQPHSHMIPTKRAFLLCAT